MVQSVFVQRLSTSRPDWTIIVGDKIEIDIRREVLEDDVEPPPEITRGMTTSGEVVPVDVEPVDSRVEPVEVEPVEETEPVRVGECMRIERSVYRLTSGVWMIRKCR